MPKILEDILHALSAFAAALVPSALGAVISQLHATALDWRQRATAYFAGIVVSYYVRLGLTAWFGLDDFAGQAVAFVIAMIAYKATPRFIDASSDAIASLPGRLIDWLTPRKDRGE